MSGDAHDLVLDTGPLSHFAKAGWLSILRVLVGEGEVVIPDMVEDELREGAHRYPHLRPVLDADWIQRRTLRSSDEIEAYAHFARRLVADGRNQGEAGVLAYVKVHGGTAVIDDGAACKAARGENILFAGLLPYYAILSVVAS